MSNLELNYFVSGRQKYNRPQALLFSKDPGKLVSKVINGVTAYGYIPDVAPDSEGIDFIILSDHNREKIDIRQNRIESRQRMVNGRMRSYHIADKINISTSWTNLPSRSYPLDPNFDANGNTTAYEYTVDGGAGGSELLEWYDNTPGSFYVYMAYDNYPELKNISSITNPYDHLGMYNQVVEVFFSDFSHTVDKRGGNFDFWNISFSLEEV